MKKLLILGAVLTSFNAQAVEVNFNPLSILSGATSVDALFEVDNKIKLGPTIGFMNLGITTVNVTAFDLGGRGEYAFSGFETQGYYVAGRLYYSNVTVKVQEDVLVCNSASTTGEFLGGHRWAWANGFSAKLGAGFKQTFVLGDGVECETNNTTIDTDVEGSNSQFNLAYEAGISWSL